MHILFMCFIIIPSIKFTVGILLLIFKTLCQPGASVHRSGAEGKNAEVKSLQEFHGAALCFSNENDGPTSHKSLIQPTD